MELQKISNEAQECIKVAQAVIVSDQQSYEQAVAVRKNAKELQKMIEETFDPIVQKAHASWKESLEQKNKFVGPIIKAVEYLDSKIREFKLECERKEREAQEKLRREAEEKAEKERAKLEYKARLAAEAGNVKKAEELAEKAAEVEIKVQAVAPTFPKAKGDFTRTTWRATVVDFKLLPDEYKLPNEQLLNSIARNSKGVMKIQGVEFKES